jgi:microcystin-dependent protein
MFKLPSRTLAVAALGLAGALQSLPAAAQSEPLLGQIMCGAWNFAPRGWALLNGQLLPIAQNTALFSLLGTTYGGNGQTTFALPDLRGRVPMHWGQGPGLSSRDLGESGGTETNTLSVAQLPPHAHTVAPLGSNNDATAVSPAGKVPAAKARTTLYTDPVNLVAQAPTTTSAAGGGQPVNNVQPYLTFTCVIAVEGIYPSRN